MLPSMLPPVIDTHCHLTNQRFADDRDAVIAAARAAGVAQMMTIGTGLADARACLALAARFPGVLACSAGLDPHSCFEAGDAFPAQLAELEALLAGGGFNALGEIGLEYHHRLAAREVQIAQFEAQLDLAVRRDLPVVIHSRDAHPDTTLVLQRNPRSRGVIHSFTGTPADARGFLDLGWFISLNGILTFKGSDELRAAARLVPADRLLVETDAPYLAPLPLRGRRCEPGHVLHTLNFLAELRGERSEDVAAWTTRNARRLFRIAADQTAA
jgi:TatD DNase family protein